MLILKMKLTSLKKRIPMTRRIALSLLVASQCLNANPVTLDADSKRNKRAAQKIIKTLKTCANYTTETLTTNGDEEAFPADRRGNFGKSLAYDSVTFHKTEYDKLVAALKAGSNDAIEQLIGGAAPNPQDFKLVNPLATFAYDFNSFDGWKFSLPPAPSVTSAEAAGEMVECYWHALLRDVPFNEYSFSGSPAMIQEEAITGMNALSDFKGPKDGGNVTAQTLFRGPFEGEVVGPYVSQFLYLPVPLGAGINFNGDGTSAPFDSPNFQEAVYPQSGSSNNFMTDLTEWENIQKGIAPSASITMDETQRHFIRNGRDLGEYVHTDYPGEPGLHAALILLKYGPAALDQNNPYLNKDMQNGFVTFGPAAILSHVMKVTELALKAAWFNKWYVHRRLRPEVFAHLIDIEGTNPTGIHADVMGSSVLARPEFATSKLLPMAYPEGSPCHPSYPAGHAAISGAIATLLKAFFNEDFVIPNAVEPNSLNDSLVPYSGTPLTVKGELNKLGSNIAIGRNFAGVHYRSDGTEGMILGEKVAIAFLQNLGATYPEDFAGFSLTKFDGTKITVGAKS